MSGVVFDLVAQALDVDRERVLLDVGSRIVPKGIADLIARDHRALVRGEKEEQAIFQRREDHLAPVPLDVRAVGVDGERPEGNDALRGL